MEAIQAADASAIFREAADRAEFIARALVADGTYAPALVEL